MLVPKRLDARFVSVDDLKRHLWLEGSELRLLVTGSAVQLEPGERVSLSVRAIGLDPIPVEGVIRWARPPKPPHRLGAFQVALEADAAPALVPHAQHVARREDPRRSPRFKVGLGVAWTAIGGDGGIKRFPGRILDLSNNGAFISCELRSPFQSGVLAELTPLTNTDGASPILGIPARYGPPPEDGFAVRFTRLTPEADQWLANLLDRIAFELGQRRQ